MSSPVETPAPASTQSPDPVDIKGFDPGPEPPQLSETVGVAPDITAAANAAKSLGGEHAPMVAIALAGMAVAGGSKAFKLYRDWAEQKHEREMKKLEIESQNQGLEGQQPPPCAAKCAAMQVEIDGLKSKIAGIEKKTATISADFDGDDVERKVKRMKKRIDELFEIVEKS
tara:strand:- start:4481 stop:4993 length:513 start_codon:yes stop_codon:yes gene_type:complete